MLSRSVCALILLSSLVSCALPPANKGQILRGTIHWQGEIRLHGDVVLEAGSDLIIAPGTQVLFEEPRDGEDLYREHPYFVGSELIVRGRLIAQGSAAAPIIFRSESTQGGGGELGRD